MHENLVIRVSLHSFINLKWFCTYIVLFLCLTSNAQKLRSNIRFNDFSKQRIEQLSNQKNKPNKPFQFGIPLKKFIIFKDHSSKVLSDSGTVYTMSIKYDFAVNLSLILSQFDLETGETLTIQGRNRTISFNSTHATPSRRLGTSEIQGDSLYLTLHSERESNLIIEQIIFGFREARIPTSKTNAKLNSSGDCHYDVNCPEGLDWQDQKKGVVRITLGGSVCTGSLINNNLNDGTPYLLTANHCYTAFPDVSTWAFRFDYESSIPVCAGSNPSNELTPTTEINGSELRSTNNTSDFCLLELNSRPPASSYYNGWARSTLPNNDVTSIHHPDGDVKKISGSTAPLSNTTHEGISSIKVPTWNYGSTEGGSSGAPLFDDNKLIVGQLYGGSANCSGTSPNSSSDYYGSFAQSWDSNKGNSYRLKELLDPLNSNPNSQQGAYIPFSNLDLRVSDITNIDQIVCNENTVTPHIQLKNLGLTTVTSVEILILSSIETQIIQKDLLIVSNQAITVVGAPITISSPLEKLTVIIQKVNNTTDDVVENNVLSKEIRSYQDARNGEIRFKTDCYGSESTWFLYNNNLELITGQGPFEDNVSRWENTPICLPEGCFFLEILDNYGDGLSGGDNNCSENGEVEVVFNGIKVAELEDPYFGSTAYLSFCTTTNEFLVYPNPFSNYLRVENDSYTSNQASVSLYNSIGELVYFKDHNFSKIESILIPTEFLATAVYILHIQTEEELKKIKLVKID